MIPNLDHDLHDGTLAQADQWLRDHLAGYAAWAGAHNSLLVITNDEDDFTDAINLAKTLSLNGAALETAGVLVYRSDAADDVAPTVRAAAALAFHSSRAVAVLIGQRVIGTKSFEK